MDILTVFEQTAARLPDKIAVADEHSSYTFADLADLAGRLAGGILAARQAPGPVGILVDRGAETLVLLLAALRAGESYIPLDPDLPVQKLRSIVEDARPALLLGSEGRRDLAGQLGCPLLTLADAAPVPAPRPVLDEGSVLYTVYTSGSTGKPKGVVKTHGAMLSFLSAFPGRFGLGGEEVIGNQTPFFFDAAAKDIYLCLATGARLEVIPAEKFIFPVRLVEYLNQRQITYICWVPTALAIVTQLNTFRQVLPETLRRVFFVGEPFPIKQLHRWLEALPGLQYVNLYGQSELAGVCCWYEIPRGARPERLPMGKPLDNCRVYLRGEEGFLTQPDQLGEVWVESDALALEYLHDPEKTAAVFSVETLPDGRRARVLHSGDLAHYDSEGNLVFVSRKDFQIKHMGRRIELGEIESVADTVPGVVRCACLYNGEKKRIELFCQAPGLEGKAILSALRGRLTDYMLPSRVHVLDQLPLNQNGKLDRPALAKLL